MAKDIKTFKESANSNFYKPPSADKLKKSNSGLTGLLNKIYGSPKAQKFYVKGQGDFEKRGYKLFELQSFESNGFSKNYDESRLVYELAITADEDNNSKNYYYFKTGLYTGFLYITVKDERLCLEIDTGYSDIFFRRMLNVANNVFLDNTSSGAKSAKANSLTGLVSFMFLSRFKSAFAMGMPSEYKTINEHGFNVKGKIDVKKYIQKDMLLGGALSYSYKQRQYVQDVIDVLYLAMKTLKESGEINTADYEKYYRELRQMRSDKTVTHATIHNIRKHRSLNNPLYNRYKTALYFAEMVLEMKEVFHNDESSEMGFSGFLLDISQLWEVYLVNLLRKRFDNEYNILAQEELELYNDAFYKRTNRPDIVIETKDGVPVAVLDAKFKKMNYDKDDVDRGDMFQIHSYTGYYNEHSKLTGNPPLRFSALVYPSKSAPGVQTYSPLYGLNNAITQFAVEYICVKDNDNFEDIKNSEDAFLDRIEQLLENKTSAL